MMCRLIAIFLLLRLTFHQSHVQVHVAMTDSAEKAFNELSARLRSEADAAVSQHKLLLNQQAAIESECNDLEVHISADHQVAKALEDQVCTLSVQESEKTAQAWAHFAWHDSIDELPFVPRPKVKGDANQDEEEEFDLVELERLRRLRNEHNAGAASGTLSAAIDVLVQSKQTTRDSVVDLWPSLLDQSTQFLAIRPLAHQVLRQTHVSARWLWLPATALLTIFDFISAYGMYLCAFRTFSIHIHSWCVFVCVSDLASFSLAGTCRAWAIILHSAPLVWRRKQFMYQHRRVRLF
jgi:hypothetical protein